MNIPKAIEILTLDLQENPKDPCCNLEKATYLGIEALKCFSSYRNTKYNIPKMLLPSETED